VELHLSVGDKVGFAKTVGESDVYLFAGITGDFAPNHINEQFMQGTTYGRRIARNVGGLWPILRSVTRRGCWWRSPCTF